MESKDIIKALEYCLNKCDCEDCVLCAEPKCSIKLYENVLNLIKNQQAEIERLNNAFKNTIDKKYPHCVVTGKGVILTENLKKYDELIADIYNEAYKTFAKLVKSRMFNGKKYDYERNYIDNLTNELTERKED